MFPRLFVLLILICCIIFVAGSDKEPLQKCQTNCNRRFAKHQIDQKGKQRCYQRCGDSLVGDGSAPGRHGCSLSRCEENKEPPELLASRDGGQRQRRSSSNSSRRAGKKRVKNSREATIIKGSSRIFKSADGDFRLREIYGDGNCMFRAISFVLWGTETRHRYLRSLVVSHIESTWRDLRSYVLAEWNIPSASAYVAFMGADGTFASELECLVATRMNRLNLAIYRRADAAGNLRRILHSRFSRRAKAANLLFSGRNEYGHYDVLLPVR